MFYTSPPQKIFENTPLTVRIVFVNGLIIYKFYVYNSVHHCLSLLEH